jgi:hypothetical protein
MAFKYKNQFNKLKKLFKVGRTYMARFLRRPGCCVAWPPPFQSIHRGADK